MFTVYFDASGSPDQNEVLTVAGFLAPVDQWLCFRRDWEKVLSTHGVSALHMKDFAHSRGEFSSWKRDEKRRRTFLSQPAAVIWSRARHSFVGSVYLPDYRANDEKYCLSEIMRPLAMAGCGCIRRVQAWAVKYKVPQNKITYIFEAGDKHKGNLLDIAEIMCEVTPLFMKKTDNVAFQAADMLAYEFFLASPKIIKNPGKYSLSDLRKPLQLLAKVPHGENGEDWGTLENPSMEDRIKDDGIFKLRRQD